MKVAAISISYLLSMIQNQLLFLIATLILFCHSVTDAKGMWGARRKKREEEEAQRSFEESQQRAAILQDGLGSLSNPTVTRSRGGKSSSGIDIGALMNLYLNTMEELIESPNADEIFNPETFKNIFASVPNLSPELSTLLDSPQLNDPILLKQTIKEGLKSLRLYTAQIEEIFHDPEQIKALIQQLPFEYRDAVEGLLKGDTSGIKALLTTLPGITKAQTDVLFKLLDGEKSGIESAVKELLSPDAIETARQNLLKDPSYAAMFGITKDVLEDKEKFASLMSAGGKAFGANSDVTGSDDLSDFDWSNLFNAEAAMNNAA